MSKNLRFILLFLICLFFVTSTNVLAELIEPKIVLCEIFTKTDSVLVNGEDFEPIEFPPFIFKGRTMVSPRLMSVFSLNIDYDSQTKSITYSTKSKIVKITYNSPVAWVNGKEVPIDVSYLIKLGRSFIPIRFVIENFGATVTWEATLQKVTIVYEIPEGGE